VTERPAGNWVLWDEHARSPQFPFREWDSAFFPTFWQKLVLGFCPEGGPAGAPGQGPAGGASGVRRGEGLSRALGRRTQVPSHWRLRRIFGVLQSPNFSRLVDGITGARWGCLRLTVKLFAEFIQRSPWLDREQIQIPLRLRIVAGVGTNQICNRCLYGHL
jgi:hypothetical protein